MAGDKSKRPSRKTNTAKNKRSKKSNQKTDKEKTAGGIQRFDVDRAGMERMPSNAPTMAIAPSDYEHIFHEGTTGQPAASPQQPTPQTQQFTGAGPDQEGRTKPPGRSPQSPQPLAPAQVANTSHDVQVTPDGYTLLGQPPLDMNASNARRVALPSHVVRANNQFSRAALAHVARYLASRSEL